MFKSTAKSLSLSASALCLTAGLAQADFVINDDLIVDGSACIGFDCVNGESFGFDTIRIKENNLRISAIDTSSSASFPTTDWQLLFNDTSNGGQNRFSVLDLTASRTPFTIEGAAPSHALYVDDAGNVGVGTSTPVLEMHVVDGDTPTLRLQQDGSSGFQAQSWDLAGNETNFFVRDVTNGSTLPFRVRPGAPTSAIDIAASGDVGLGTSGPDAQLHVVGQGVLVGPADIGAPAAPAQLHVYGSDGSSALMVEESSTTAAARGLLTLQNNGTVFATLTDTSTASTWNIQNNSTELRMTNSSVAGIELALDQNGNLEILGGLVTGTAGICTAGTPCDRVFDPEVYEVPSIEEHAALMWQNKHLPAVGPTLAGEPMDVSTKLLRMLNELEHAHIYIEQVNAKLAEQTAELDMLKRKVNALQ